MYLLDGWQHIGAKRPLFLNTTLKWHTVKYCHSLGEAAPGTRSGRQSLSTDALKHPNSTGERWDPTHRQFLEDPRCAKLRHLGANLQYISTTPQSSTPLFVAVAQLFCTSSPLSLYHW